MPYCAVLFLCETTQRGQVGGWMLRQAETLRVAFEQQQEFNGEITTGSNSLEIVNYFLYIFGAIKNHSD